MPFGTDGGCRGVDAGSPVAVLALANNEAYVIAAEAIATPGVA